MAADSDFRYFRRPDGRTGRVRNVGTLRTLVRGGRIPWESRARRSGDESWLPLTRHRELSDLHPPDAHTDEPAGTKARANGHEMQTVGVRGLVDELFNAFDSSLSRVKWAVAAGMGLALAVGGIVAEQAAAFPDDATRLGIQVGTAAVVLALFSACTYVVTQMTAVELSRFRPASSREIREGLVRQSAKVFVAQAVLVAFVAGVMLLLRNVPDLLGQADAGEYGALRDGAQAVLAVARLLIDVLGWPILGLALFLLGPILVVEDFSLVQGLREWLRMLARHPGRIYLYEALAVALAVVMTLPLFVPVYLTGTHLAGGRGLYVVELVTLRLLAGVALTPLIAYLLVANVYIYLNLRYEFYFSRDR
jgi:hypothetical protein